MTSPRNLSLAYVGSVVPDRASFDGPAFSRAGNLFQENLIASMEKAGLPFALVLSQRPIRAFPNSRTLWMSTDRTSLASGRSVQLLPFLNLPLLRPITVGLSLVFSLITWKIKQDHDADGVVICYNLTEPSGLFILFAARLIGAKAIAAVLDINIPGQTIAPTLSRRLDFTLQKLLIPRFDGIIVVNRRIAEDFAPKTPYIRVEGGVNQEVLEHFRQSRSRSKNPDDLFTIVSAGSLDEANGFVELLQAFALLESDKYRLRIAGKGPLRSLVEEAATRDPRIEYCGYLPFADVLRLYDTGDILINMRLTHRIDTSYFFPSKTMEYLASGIPVISTCTGHIAEEYSGFCYLLREETPEALAQMIEHVASLEPEARLLGGAKAKEHIRLHNSWEAQGKRIVEFIRTIVTRR